MDRTIALNDGRRVPRLGFGTFKLTEADRGQAIVEKALEIGYRLIDTASYYRNEAMVGRALAAAGLPRADLTVATKVWPVDFDPDAVRRSVERSLNELGLDYIDILYVHWPSEGFETVWEIFESYRDQGMAKTLAVCNFHREHLDRLARISETVPAIDQLETHPYLQLDTLRQVLEERGIRHQSWGPLAQGKTGLLQEAAVTAIATAQGCTPAQPGRRGAAAAAGMPPRLPSPPAPLAGCWSCAFSRRGATHTLWAWQGLSCLTLLADR